MTRAVYMNGDTALTPDQRKSYAGCRLENAAYFQGVSSEIESAIIIGDYPKIEDALKEASIDFDVIEAEEALKEAETLYSVTKEGGKRASKQGLTKDQADEYVAANPESKYVIEAE